MRTNNHSPNEWIEYRYRRRNYGRKFEKFPDKAKKEKPPKFANIGVMAKYHPFDALLKPTHRLI